MTTTIQSLTVAQLETLARRARERDSDRAAFYRLGHLLVEVVHTPSSRVGSDGPRETLIRDDGSTDWPHKWDDIKKAKGAP